MKKSMLRLIFIFLILSAAFTLLNSCNKAGIGIFYSLEIEEKRSDTGSLDKNLSPLKMVSFNNSYYVAAKTLFSRAKGDTLDWIPVELPASEKTLFAYDLAASADSLFTLLYTDSLETVPETFLYKSSNGQTFIKNSATGIPADSQFISIYYLNNNLFICVKEGSSYSLYYSTDGADSFSLSNIPQNTTPVLGAAYNSADSAYWFITKDKIYSGTAPGSLAAIDPPAGTINSLDWGGIYYSDTLDRIFLSSNHKDLGKIFYRDGGSWIASAAISNKSGKIVRFYGFSEYPVQGSDNIYLLVGTLDNGYYEMKLETNLPDSGFIFSTPANNSTTSDNYYGLDLHNSTIRSFFYDETEKRMFLCTQGFGLWYNKDGIAWNSE